DMERLPLDHVELVVARDHLVNGAIDVEVEDRRLETAGIDMLERLVEGDGDGDGGLLVTIDNGGNTSLTTQFASGPLAHSLTRLCLEHFAGSHGIIHSGLVYAIPSTAYAPVLQG